MNLPPGSLTAQELCYEFHALSLHLIMDHVASTTEFVPADIGDEIEEELDDEVLGLVEFGVTDEGGDLDAREVFDNVEVLEGSFVFEPRASVPAMMVRRFPG